MNRTSITWTHRPETGGEKGGYTWNPVRARDTVTGKVGTFCTRCSPGCAHCYASLINIRFGTGHPYEVPYLDRHEIFLDEKILAQPLKRKKPATIFVGDMFDLFHEAIHDDLIDQVLAVATVCSQHTFQFLTKRARRMMDYFDKLVEQDGLGIRITHLATAATGNPNALCATDFPAPNLWFGVSVESQKYADERIPLLLQTPAAVRFLSVEPMLEGVDLRLNDEFPSADGGCYEDARHGIHWVIAGSESGHNHRPMKVEWMESLYQQCKAAGVAFFCKQDSHRFPGRQGRIPDELWAVKEFPNGV